MAPKRKTETTDMDAETPVVEAPVLAKKAKKATDQVIKKLKANNSEARAVVREAGQKITKAAKTSKTEKPEKSEKSGKGGKKGDKKGKAAPGVEKKELKKKKKRRAPKAKSPYMFFYQATFPVIRAEQKEIPITEIAKIIGSRWKALAEDARTPYKTLAAEAAEAIKAAKGPKRARSPYMFFYQKAYPEIRADPQYAEVKITEVAKVIGLRWKGLSEDDRKPYVAKAEMDKRRWVTEKAKADAAHAAATATVTV